MAIYVFVPEDFKEEYPEYASVTDKRLNLFFENAILIVNNTDASPVPYSPPDVLDRQTLLDLLVAHMSELMGPGRGAGAVGRTSSGSEGSVSFSLDMATTTSSAWYQQTQWGSMFWQMTLKYRQMRSVNLRNRR